MNLLLYRLWKVEFVFVCMCMCLNVSVYMYECIAVCHCNWVTDVRYVVDSVRVCCQLKSFQNGNHRVIRVNQ